MDILPFEPRFADEVSRLIVSIQRGEFAIEITAEQQPDLADIPGFYQVRSGNFWVALAEGRVVGTISLLDIGSGQGALRKMFVHPDFRRSERGSERGSASGSEPGTAKRLLDALLAWARVRSFREIFLGTTAKFLAAHRFYEKNGFTVIPREALPPAFPVMVVDTRFYRLGLAG